MKPIDPRDIYLSPLTQDTLCPLIWNEAVIDESVRLKLLDIAERFFKYLNLREGIVMKDAIITGSMANFNWNSNLTSDLDVHVIIDGNQIPATPEYINNLLTTKKILWNRLRKNVRVKGMEVELYAQLQSEDHKASGQFSLLNNKWLVIPQRQKEITIDEYKVKEIIALFQNLINKLSDIQDNDERYIEAVRIKDAIIKLRRTSIASALSPVEGEYSEGNVIFKFLRNAESNGLSALFDHISNCYNTKLSLSELNKLQGQLLTEEITSTDEKKIRELVRKELELIMKKQPTTSEKDVRLIVKKMLLNFHKFLWDKKGVWQQAL